MSAYNDAVSRILFFLAATAAGCASAPPPDAAQRDVARRDFDRLSPAPVERPEILPAHEAAGYAYQIGLKYPLAHILSSSWSAALAIPADVAVGSLAPIMGSSVQDAIEDAAITGYERGASFDRIYEAIPPVNPDEKDLYMRDHPSGTPGPLRLEPARR